MANEICAEFSQNQTPLTSKTLENNVTATDTYGYVEKWLATCLIDDFSAIDTSSSGASTTSSSSAYWSQSTPTKQTRSGKCLNRKKMVIVFLVLMVNFCRYKYIF